MSRRSKRNNNDKGGGGAPSWITTFSDLMSLLLTFFILLYSMSNVDAVKFKNLTRSLQSVLTGMESTSILDGSSSEEDLLDNKELDPDAIYEAIELNDRIEEMYWTVEEYVSDMGLDAEVSVNKNKRGVFVDIKDAILFESGNAELKESGVEMLEQLEGLFKDFKNDIVIEGHTDNVPIRNMRYSSNWELSTARAVSVVRHLSEIIGLDPKRFSATGFGEFNPIVSNDTRESRSINRRVNILIIFDEESDGIYGN